MRPIAMFLFLLALLALGGCKDDTVPAGGSNPSAGETPAPAKAARPPLVKPPEPPAIGADDPVVPGQVGTVTGRITFRGTPPPPRRILITKDHAVCGQGEREVVEVDVEGGMLRNAVAYVAGQLEGADLPEPPAEGHHLVQRGCRFVPYIMHVPRGRVLHIENDDMVAHNIHAYEIIGRARRDVMNQSQPKQGHHFTHEINPRRGEAIQLTCDIHDFMFGWIFVPPNPLAVVVEDGTFTLAGVPAGRRTIKVYHPHLGTLDRQVRVEAGGQVSAEFTFEVGG